MNVSQFNVQGGAVKTFCGVESLVFDSTTPRILSMANDIPIQAGGFLQLNISMGCGTAASSFPLVVEESGNGGSSWFQVSFMTRGSGACVLANCGPVDPLCSWHRSL